MLKSPRIVRTPRHDRRGWRRAKQCGHRGIESVRRRRLQGGGNPEIHLDRHAKRSRPFTAIPGTFRSARLGIRCGASAKSDRQVMFYRRLGTGGATESLTYRIILNNDSRDQKAGVIGARQGALAGVPDSTDMRCSAFGKKNGPDHARSGPCVSNQPAANSAWDLPTIDSSTLSMMPCSISRSSSSSMVIGVGMVPLPTLA